MPREAARFSTDRRPTVVTLRELVQHGARRLEAAGVSFGHGTRNAWDEAAWLVLWQLGLPLDTDLDAADGPGAAVVAEPALASIDALLTQRITTRQPAAYLTGEAWLQGLPFVADPRAIVPRSLIAELLVAGELDPWLDAADGPVLDLCTGGASLAILAALQWPDRHVDATDLSESALELAAINLRRHGMVDRVSLHQGDGLAAAAGPYALILCNPPYVNSQSMAELPPEYRAEPGMALDGGTDGMDFIRGLIAQAPRYLTDDATLVLELGHERTHFEAAFPRLEALWLPTSAGDDLVCAVTRAALLAQEAA